MELEKSILNSLTTDEGCKRAWDSGLRPEHFVKPLNQSIFEFIQDYWLSDHLAPTAEVIVEEFPHFEPIEPEESLNWLIEKIQSRFVHNQVQELNENVAKLNAESKSKDALALIASQSFEISQSVTDRKSSVNIADIESISERRARYLERAKFEGDVRGVPLGFDAIDKHTFGILPGEFASYAGYSGTGKSFALGHAAIAAYRAGYKPYFYTLEIPKDDFEDRLDCLMSGVAYTRLLAGSLTREEVKALHVAQEELKDTKGIILDNPKIGDRGIHQLVNKAIQNGADFLLIDQLSFVESRRRYSQTRDGYGEIVHELKALISGGDEKIAALMAVQFNRQQKADKGRGGQWNIGESSFVERASDFVFGLTQDDEHKANDVMIFDLMKSRRGPEKSWLLNWHLLNKTEFSVEMEIGRDD